MKEDNFCIIGPGRLGTTLALSLSKKGWRFTGSCGRTAESSERACRAVGSGIAAAQPQTVSRKSDLVFITTPDDIINGICSRIVEKGGIKKGAVVAHCSGVLTSHALSPAKEAGALTASMHPLQTFASAEKGAQALEGTYCSIEGDEKAVEVLETIAGALKMKSIRISAANKALYHAGAVVASNLLVALLDIAREIEHVSGLPKAETLKALSPLIWRTIDNVENLGTHEALTGPFARGDVETIKMHIESMQQSCPGVLPTYKALGLRALALGEKKGLSSECAGKIRNLLDACADPE